MDVRPPGVRSTFECDRPRCQLVSVDTALLDRGDPLTVSYQATDEGFGRGRQGGRRAGRRVADRGDDGRSREHAGVRHRRHGGGALRDRAPRRRRAELARVGFVIRDPQAEIGSRPTRATRPASRSSSRGGRPRNRWDWLGVYRADAADPRIDGYTIWNYTGLHASGTDRPWSTARSRSTTRRWGSRGGRCDPGPTSCTTS